MAKNKSNSALYYFHEGTNFQAYQYFGCHLIKKGKKKTYSFRVWAPSARLVTVVGDFCDWDNGIPMQKISQNGVKTLAFGWEIIYNIR